MTAYEMADILSKYDNVKFDNLKLSDVVTVLRFQSYEIKALLEQINELQRIL